jgi:hypothetical protein
MRIEQLGIVSYNLWRDNDREKVAKDVTFLLGRSEVDIICFQEGAGWYDLIFTLVLHTRDTWSMAVVADGGRSAKQNIVLWRKRRLEKKSVRFIDLPEGRKGVPDRRVTRVRLRVRGTERQLVVLATHLHSHVENRKWWRLPRQADYRKHVQIIRRLAKAPPSSRAVVAVADWNVNLKSRLVDATPFFPKHVLRQAGMRSNWETLGFKGHSGTHGRRFIDAAFLRSAGWLRFHRQQVIRMSSDHKALLVRFNVVVK